MITSGSLLETILLAQFPADKSQKLPTELQGVASDPLSYSETVVHNNEEFFRSYGDYFQDTCKWCMLTMIHTPVKGKNFETRLLAWAY